MKPVLGHHQGSRLFGSSPEAPDRSVIEDQKLLGDQPQPENNLEMIEDGDMALGSQLLFFQKILNAMGFKLITNGGTFRIHVLI